MTAEIKEALQQNETLQREVTAELKQLVVARKELSKKISIIFGQGLDNE
jgi:hypothetical protein